MIKFNRSTFETWFWLQLFLTIFGTSKSSVSFFVHSIQILRPKILFKLKSDLCFPTEFCHQLESNQNKEKQDFFLFLRKSFKILICWIFFCTNESLVLFRQNARFLVYSIHSGLIRIQLRKSKQDFFSWKIDFQMPWLTIHDFHAVTRRWKFQVHIKMSNRNNSTYLGLVRRKSGLHAVNFTTNRCSRRRCTLCQKFSMTSEMCKFVCLFCLDGHLQKRMCEHPCWDLVSCFYHSFTCN